MPKYRVTADCFINDNIVKPGAEIEFAGVPNNSMEPLDDAAKAAVAERDAVLDAKAVTLASGLQGAASDVVLQAIQALEARLAAAEVKIAFADANIGELDIGVNLVTGRVDEIDGILQAAMKPASGRAPKVAAAVTPATEASAPVDAAPVVTDPPVV